MNDNTISWADEEMQARIAAVECGEFYQPEDCPDASEVDEVRSEGLAVLSRELATPFDIARAWADLRLVGLGLGLASVERRGRELADSEALILEWVKSGRLIARSETGGPFVERKSASMYKPVMHVKPSDVRRLAAEDSYPWPEIGVAVEGAPAVAAPEPVAPAPPIPGTIPAQTDDLILELRRHREAIERAAREAEQRHADEQIHAGFARIRAATEAGIKAAHSTQEPSAHPAPVAAPAEAVTVAPKGVQKREMVKRHAARWPTIETDMKDAGTNGLAAAAKAGARGWREADALEWAREKERLLSAPEPGTLDAVMRGGFPSRRHTLAR